MCQICHKRKGIASLIIETGQGEFIVDICCECKTIIPNWYLAICQRCNSTELWNKSIYHNALKIPLTQNPEMIETVGCLKCTKMTYGR